MSSVTSIGVQYHRWCLVTEVVGGREEVEKTVGGVTVCVMRAPRIYT